jgi:hypothetical protein
MSIPGREVVEGFMGYHRHGNLVITSFFCRFAGICAAVLVPPDTGLIRADSLLFPARPNSTGIRIYVRVH